MKSQRAVNALVGRNSSVLELRQRFWSYRETRAESSKAHFLACLPKVFRGTHVTDPALTFLQAREVAFHADRPFTAFADGDPIAELPATIRVIPRALRVLAP